MRIVLNDKEGGKKEEDRGGGEKRKRYAGACISRFKRGRSIGSNGTSKETRGTFQHLFPDVFSTGNES